MDKKFTSIQELENIQFDDYKDKPEELIRIGKELLKAKRFEKSIEVFEFALKQKIRIKNNDEFSVDCAKFYYYYANALINKLLETCDMFQDNVKQKQNVIYSSVNQNNDFQHTEDNLNPNENNVDKSIMKKTNIIEEEENKTNIQHDVKNYELSDDSQNEEEEEEESDETIAFYNLAMSEKILKSFLKKYEGISRAELPTKIIEYYLDLSDIYLKYGELEQYKSDYKSAYEFFLSSLDILKLYDQPFSRAVAEVYYFMANVADYDARLAMSCFYKTYLIMKKLLMKELKTEININIDFDNVKKEDLQLDNDLLIVKSDDNEEIVDLKGIMTELKQKIEDVSEEIKIMDQLEIERRSLNKAEFTKQYDESTLIDLNKAGIIKKRKVENSELLNEVNSEKVAKITENGVNKMVPIDSSKLIKEDKSREKEEENNNIN